MTSTRFAAALLTVMALVPPAWAADARAPVPTVHHGYEQAQALVDAAVAHLKTAGPQKAFADFNDPKGKWIKGDLYVFVFDAKGVYKATGFRPERTGSDAWEMTDAAGLKVVQEIIKKATRNGSGLVDYLWKNPATGKLENKTSYVVLVGDLVVGAGFYHQ